LDQRDERYYRHLAAVVEGSDDAIISKNLNSIISSWNPGAEQLFGYRAEEAIGKSIYLLIPEDRHHEELHIISRMRRGERIENFETVRQKKDGTLVPVSLTISPVKNEQGEVVGASKIARDITVQRQLAEQQQMLLSEMRHRVSNCFAVSSGLLTMTAREARSIEELIELTNNRYRALAKAHAVALHDPEQSQSHPSRTLTELIRVIIEPFVDERRVRLTVANLQLSHAAITPLALVLYELATNAVKYGAFSESDGILEISSTSSCERLRITWSERLQRKDSMSKGAEGYGTRMIRRVIESQLAGKLERRIDTLGFHMILDLDLKMVADFSDNG